MEIRENQLLRPKTTMRIGGAARYFADLKTKADVEYAVQFAKEKHVPLIPLGSGSNTIFADGTINALIVQVKHDEVSIEGNSVGAGAGKNLPMLINELSEKGLDLSALTGIPGTIGGAVFGNAGQGPKGTWMNSFVVSVEAFVDGDWKIFTKDELSFRYRESRFKDAGETQIPPLLWRVELNVPSAEVSLIKANVETLLKRRIETQPHLKTAGSCFKAVGETPAWQLIDAAGLRGFKVGGVEIAQKHANFLLNVGEAKFSDAVAAVQTVIERIPAKLEVEMRFYREDGGLEF